MTKRIYAVVLSLLATFAAAFSCYPYIKNAEVVQSIVSGLDFLKDEKKEIENETAKAPVASDSEPVDAPDTAAPTQNTDTTAPPVTTAAPVTTTPPETTQPPQTTAPVTTAPPPAETEPPKDYIPPAPVEPSEFDNSLFIGDSRTMGLLYYGGLGNADVFATKGMTVFRAFTETINVKSVGDTTLEPLLDSRQYERVYIMLGINEIGSNIEGIKAKYSVLVNKVMETQPDAAIYVCANLHITQSRSEKDSIYNNTRLNAINDYVATLADGGRVKYINVNEIFDDSTGSFGAAYTTDDFHPMPKYYKQWTQWLGTVT